VGAKVNTNENGQPLGLGLSQLLGPLPEAAHRGPTGTGAYFDAYTAAQMRAYAAEQVAAERERCAQIVGRLVD
jgi:hypothetical protein